MYLYERKLGSLKRTVRNKARVEGSIVESYLVNELSNYCSLYCESTIQTRLNREPRNFAPEIPTFSNTDPRLSIFKVPSRKLFEKGGKQIALTDAEMHKIHTYVLLNCEEVHSSISMFDAWIKETEPCIEDGELDKRRENLFAKWYEVHVMQGSDENNQHLKDIAPGPLRYDYSHSGYFVNGYKFHTVTHGDYYGLLEEVLEVEYHSNLGLCVVVLFKCRWFDPVKGVRVDYKHNLVDVNYKSKGCIDDLFVLASQADQVY